MEGFPRDNRLGLHSAVLGVIFFQLQPFGTTPARRGWVCSTMGARRVAGLVAHDLREPMTLASVCMPPGVMRPGLSSLNYKADGNRMRLC